MAIENNNKDAIKMLLERDDIDINLKNLHNLTPFELAQNKKNNDIINLFEN